LNGKGVPERKYLDLVHHDHAHLFTEVGSFGPEFSGMTSGVNERLSLLHAASELDVRLYFRLMRTGREGVEFFFFFV
jgi:hypothetical protein